MIEPRSLSSQNEASIKLNKSLVCVHTERNLIKKLFIGNWGSAGSLGRAV